MSEGVRIGVAGGGHWGRNHLRNFDALGVLAAFCDVDPKARAAAAEAYPAARAYAGFEEMLADRTLDGVVIATPSPTHGALTAQAVGAGKHVFCEKPLCLDVAQAERLRTEAQERHLTLMVGHLLLYHPAFRELLRRVRAGDLGTLRYIYSTRLALGKVRREESALFSFAPHDVSMILQLAGSMPERVTATGGHYLTPGIADTTLTHMAFSGELQAHIFVSWLHPFKDQRLVVVGEKAMLVFDDVRPAPEKLLLYRHGVDCDGEIPVVTRAEAEPVGFPATEPLRNECQAFLDAIEGRASPPSDAEEGIRVLRVLDAAQRSIADGVPVTLGRPRAA